MFRHTIARSTLVLAAALAAVSATGLADVASAATRPPTPAVTATQAKPPPTTGVTTVQRDNSRTTVRDAFSAGLAGYGDAYCAALLGGYNTLDTLSSSAELLGNQADADSYGASADDLYDQLTSNCVVIE